MKKLLSFENKNFRNRFKYAVIISLFTLAFLLLHFFYKLSKDSGYTKTSIFFLIFAVLFTVPLIFASYSEIISLFKQNVIFDFVWIFLFMMLPCTLLIYYVYASTAVSYISYLLCWVVSLFLVILNSHIMIKKHHTRLEKDIQQAIIKLIVLFYLFWNSIFFMFLLNKTYVLVILALIPSANDSLAYLCGKRFGKIKILTHSPNKTLEGLVSGIVLATILCFILSAIFKWSKIFSSTYSIWWLIPLLLLLSVISHFGDYCFSMIKRKIRIKDFSDFFWNHGGFWDRFDSHCFVMTAAFTMQLFFSFLP